MREYGHNAAHHKEEEEQDPDGGFRFFGTDYFSFHDSDDVAAN